MGDWRERAECLKSPDPDAWFTERVTGPGREVAEYALGFCRRCPVQGECLGAALAMDVRWGIWGGTTSTQRGWHDDTHRARTVGGAG